MALDDARLTGLPVSAEGTSPVRMRRAAASDLADKVSCLASAAAYGLAADAVETRETHMSWVFLTPDRVYKLKKPLRRPFLDFSTLRRRHFFCAEEIRLNRRLAAETYLGVRPLRRDRGSYHLGGKGRVADWLVEMKRLGAGDMMDRRLADGHVGAGEIAALAGRLCDFYRSLPPQRADGRFYLSHLTGQQRINGAMLRAARLGPADELVAATDAALADMLPEIEARIAAGHIVEGHGDLRPEHVWLGQPLQIIDCLEFSRPMRILDPYDEVNYLGMECELLGAGWIRQQLGHVLSLRLGHPPSPRLLAVYGAFRALMRARLSIAHLLERPVRKPEKWRPLALRYLEQARCELARSRP